MVMIKINLNTILISELKGKKYIEISLKRNIARANKVFIEHFNENLIITEHCIFIWKQYFDVDRNETNDDL